MTASERIRYNYNRLSKWYDLIAAPSERRGRLSGLRLLGVKEGNTVLEIGFGTGHGLVALARAVGRSGKVYGIDISSGMMAVAREKVAQADLADRVALQYGDAAALPFRDQSFEAVFSSFVLELFDEEGILRVLAESCRVLRSGGHLCLVNLSRVERPGLASRLYDWAHVRFPNLVDCRPIAVEQAVAGAGFHVLEVQNTSMWGVPVAVVLAESP